MFVMLFSRIFQCFQIFPNYNFSFQFWILSNFWIFFPIFVIFFFNFSILVQFQFCQFFEFVNFPIFCQIFNFSKFRIFVQFFIVSIFFTTWLFNFVPFFNPIFILADFSILSNFQFRLFNFFFYNFQVCPFLFNFDHIVSKSKLKINSCFKK